MPRDTTGKYTLPAGNPVSPGEIVSSEWANLTMNDVGVALSDSLDRGGKGGMLAPFKFSDGTLQLPGATFTNEPSSGLFRAGAGDVRMSIQGQPKMRWRNPGDTEVWDRDTGAWLNIFNIGAKKGVIVNVVSVDTPAIAGNHYHCDTAGLTITLPSNPSVSDQVGVSVQKFTDVVVASNGRPIAGAVQDVTMDLEDLYLQFQWTGTPEGWIVVSQALSSAVTGGLPTAGQTDGDTLAWDDTTEQWTSTNRYNFGRDGVFSGVLSGDVPDQRLTHIKVEAALPGTPSDNVLYIIPAVGIFFGSVLVAEVN